MVSAIATSLLLLLLAALCVVEGKEEFVKRIPNGDGVAGVKALGHVNQSGSGALSVFGEAFKAAGLKWTVALCLADSDGDGQTNGEELGDPCCVWHAAAGFNPPDIPTFSANVSNPSDPKDVVATAILEQWVCGYQPSSSSSSSDAGGQSTAGNGANPSTQGATSGTSTTDSSVPTGTPSTTTQTSAASRSSSRAALVETALLLCGFGFVARGYGRHGIESTIEYKLTE